MAEAELKVESERVRVEKEYLGCSRRPSETVRQLSNGSEDDGGGTRTTAVGRRQWDEDDGSEVLRVKVRVKVK